MKYTEPRYTKDLEVWVEASAENSLKVYSALQKFGAPLLGIRAVDFESDGFFQMGVPPVRIDILMSIDGVDWEGAWTRRQLGDFDGVPAFFLDKSDLVAAKTAAGRTQDILDIESLRNANPDLS
ncbi:MAG: hypothetical protein AB7J13_10045 [Pyrinomonadaceae bacterium]